MKVRQEDIASGGQILFDVDEKKPELADFNKSYFDNYFINQYGFFCFNFIGIGSIRLSENYLPKMN